MPRRRLTRLLAVVAALLFFAGETGTSELDALLYHSGGAAAVRPVYPHVESGQAGQRDHADHCLLMFRLASGRVSAGMSVAVRLQGVGVRAAPAQPPAVPTRFYPGLHQQSRAPPASPA
jgi:hypothetical protein